MSSLPAALELYLLSIRAQALLDELGQGETSLRKSYRGINRFVENASESMELAIPHVHDRCVHNYNVIQNAINIDVLGTDIGSLEL